MSLPAGTHVGKYVIQRKLAEGGMAEIFLASSFGPEGFEKQVIIKRIRPTFADDPAFVEMFVSEARLVSKLNHSNIVQIFDFDRHEETFYIAMEYVRGKSLAQAHQRSLELGIPPTPPLASEIISEVARGLSFAHRLTEHGQPLGLVHRDVTPQNVLLSYDGAVKLTDFGIAKAGTRASTVGMLKGKFAYMSPEQSRGQPVDSRTDIFALGITFWELLSGVRLFDAESDVAVLNAVQERAVVPPEQLNASVDTKLSAIVMRCLERDRAARFQTAQELERALARYLSTAAPGPEETDVGVWMQRVFPIEASRVESTEFRQEPFPGTLRSGPSAQPGLSRPATARVISGSAPPAGVAQSMTSNPGSAAGPDAVWEGPTARTPIVLRDVTQEPPTHTTEPIRPKGRRALFVGVALGGATVVVAAAAVGVLLGKKLEAPTPQPTPPTLPAPFEVVKPPEPIPPPAPSKPEPEMEAAKPSAPTKSPSKRRHASAKTSQAPLSTTPGVQAQSPAPKAAASAAPGTLVLTVHPAGDVFIDGERRRKQDGKAEYQLSPGKHHLEVRGPSNWTKDIVLAPDEKTWEWAYR